MTIPVLPLPSIADADEVSAGAKTSLGANSGVLADPAKREVGGRSGPEPTRFGDWERAGRCIDF